jgi:uncharacterized FAD-dependent dehydrogenase
MIKQIEIIVSPDYVNDREYIYRAAAKAAKCNIAELKAAIPVRRSIDARSKNPIYRVMVEAYINEAPPEQSKTIEYKNVENSKTAIIIGSGPAGLFAALKLLELGIKPVIFERGKDVQARRKDLRNIQQLHIVNPDSNYCFGEGGAGTYSDGKLYTRSTKKGDVKKILSIFVNNGAHPDILIDAHPHIGSNKLPGVIKSMRETIVSFGGEIHFESKLTGLIIDNGKVKGVVINETDEHLTDAVILATGHSARDIYYLLNNLNITLEEKPFAMGVRIEHPQALINEIQYHSKNFNKNLPAASYMLKCDIEGRGVYSFCMCPGGIIIPASTMPGEMVVNGMSVSRRDSPYANSGFVVTVKEEDWSKYKDKKPFGALMLQQEIEQLAFKLGGDTLSAPAQRATDFVEGKLSGQLNKTSYIPGIVPAPLHEALPKFISKNLKAALKIFNQKMRGYYTSEAQLLGVESRTSSPVRIPRGEDYMHINVSGLFPAGEGAGYAGGIVSAAIDGENAAQAVARFLNL